MAYYLVLLLQTRQLCIVRKPAAEFCHKLNSRLGPLLTEKDHIEGVTCQSHLYTSSSCGKPCYSGLRACVNEHSMMFSTLCSPSSPEEKRSYSTSEDIPPTNQRQSKEPKLPASPFARHRWYTLALSKTFHSACQCGCRVFQQHCADVHTYHRKQLPRILLIEPSFLPISGFSPLGESPCVDNTWLPTLVLRLLLKRPDRKRASPRQLAVAPSLISHLRGVNEGAQCTFCICSQGKLIRAFPNNSSPEICRELWLYHFLGPRFSLPISNLYCRTSVDCYDQPDPVHYSELTSFLQAVAIFLLVRQELERIDQVVTHSLLCRVCPKYVGTSVVRAVLYDQDSVRGPPLVLAAAIALLFSSCHSRRASTRPTRCGLQAEAVLHTPQQRRRYWRNTDANLASVARSAAGSTIGRNDGGSDHQEYCSCEWKAEANFGGRHER